MLKSSLRNRRRFRSYRFVPMGGQLSADLGLERRTSTTGLFWGLTASTDPSQVQAWIVAGIPPVSSPNINTPLNNYLTNVSSTYTLTNDNGFGDISTMVGTATAQIIDNGSSPNSGVPVGNSTISQVITAEIDLSAPSSNPFGGSAWGNLEVGSLAEQDFLLADDGTGSPPTTLTEHYYISYTAPANEVYTDSSMGQGGSTSGIGWLMSPGNATITSGTDGYFWLTPNTSGTITTSNGSTVTYTFNTDPTSPDPSTTLCMTVVTPIADLPGSSGSLPTQTGDVTTMDGLRFSVGNMILVDLSGEPPYGTTDSASWVVEYSAHM